MEKYTFNFFHSGLDTKLPECLVRSIKISNPTAKIRQLSDLDTPLIAGVDDCVRLAGSKEHIMLFRARAYAELKFDDALNIFVDTDMLVIRQISPHSFPPGKITVCERFFDKNSMVNTDFKGMGMFEYVNKSLYEAWPYLGCFLATRTSAPLVELYYLMQSLEPKYKDWYGDQIALKSYVEREKEKICTVSERRFAYLPDSMNDWGLVCEDDDICLVHFKGLRKKLMPEFFRLYSLHGFSDKRGSPSLDEVY